MIPEKVLSTLGTVLRSGLVRPTDFEMVKSGMAELDWDSAWWMAMHEDRYDEALIALMRTNGTDDNRYTCQEVNAKCHQNV